MQNTNIALVRDYDVVRISQHKNADPIVVPGQNITVTGTANFVGGVWQYRFTITETGGIAVEPVRFILSEHQICADANQ